LIRTAEKAGIRAVADEMKCSLVEFNRPVLPPKRGGKIFKQLEIDQTVLEAGVIINLPKLKTHSLTLLTLGVKNLFGCIPGPRKALWHLKAGEDRKTFAKILVDVYQIIQPSLTILDGIVGMDGSGPNSGRPVPLGLILASGDSLSLDQIVCDLLGISRKSLLTNRVAFEQGMGKDKINVLGERVEEVKISDFQFPTLSQPDWNLPGFLMKALKNALTTKPVIEEEVCKSCDRCTEICPPKALAKKGKDLIFDYKKCIRCFCCLEVCPEGAISIKPGWALNVYNQIRSTKSGRSIP
jgi:ferredoxin